MTRIDLDTIRESGYAFMKTTVEVVSKLLLRVIAQQIRTAKRADKEEVTTEACNGLRSIPFLIEEDKAQMLGGMTRRVEHNQTHHADLEYIAIAQRMMLHAVPIRHLIIRAKGKRCARRFGKGQGAGSEVRMNVGLGYVLDRKTLLVGVLCVTIEVAHRVAFRTDWKRLLRRSTGRPRRGRV